MFALSMLMSSLSFPMVAKAQDPNKTVYIVFNVDTEPSSSVVGNTDPHPTANTLFFSRTSPNTVAGTFNDGLRYAYPDMDGNPFKMTWYAQMDYVMSQCNFAWADGSPAGVSGYTAIRDLLVNVWGDKVAQYGDSIEYHHHFINYDETWQQYNPGPNGLPRPDAGYPGYQEDALDHIILDRGLYPSAWRSGDWVMTPWLSSWLDEWVPLDYTPYSNFGPFSPTNPTGGRWQVDTMLIGWMYDPDPTKIPLYITNCFDEAQRYDKAIASFVTHTGSDMPAEIACVQGYLAAAQAAYPDVDIKYVTAQEAVQQYFGWDSSDSTPPTFTIVQAGSTFTITSSESLWQNHPYIAVKYADGTYLHATTVSAGTNTWTVTPTNAGSVTKIGVGASDLHGNTNTQTMDVSAVQHSLTVASAHDSPSPTVGAHSYLEGTSVTASVTSPVSEGSLAWTCTGWTGTGSVPASGSGSSVTFTITQDSSITWNWVSAPAWTITVTQSSHGTIMPATASYPQGSSQNEVITPDSGYYIASITVDGSPATITSPSGQTVTFSNIQAPHTITATFAPITWSITVTQSAHGTISPSTASYAQGASQDEVVTPDSGYYIASITVDGNPVAVTTPSGQTVSFNNIQTDHTITATYAQNT
ncbi:MAG TPA: hypothetical protein VK253_01815, partial [Candidatus Binatia bacterium]|nr:hypothetical protein [Candidatus Binatia bacterium]